MFSPVNSGVCDAEPEESKNDVFPTATHDVEEVFLCNPFNVCVKSASVMDCAGFVCGLVYIVDKNRGGEFLDGELVSPDKLSVDAADISARVYQHRGVNDF